MEENEKEESTGIGSVVAVVIAVIVIGALLFLGVACARHEEPETVELDTAAPAETAVISKAPVRRSRISFFTSVPSRYTDDRNRLLFSPPERNNDVFLSAKKRRFPSGSLPCFLILPRPAGL